MLFKNSYRCVGCHATQDAFVEGKTMEDVKQVRLICGDCGAKTEHIKLIGGYKSRWHYFDPQR